MNKINNMRVVSTVYFEYEGSTYRATSLEDIEKLYGESWEQDYNFVEQLSEEDKGKLKELLGDEE